MLIKASNGTAKPVFEQIAVPINMTKNPADRVFVL